MADKEILLLLYFSLFCFCHTSKVYTQLKQGDRLSFSDQLVSTNRLYALGFSRKYLVINCTYKDELSYHPVWPANRDKPIIGNSDVLAIDDVGKLIITHSGGQIELYSGKSASTENLTAVLENNGNFVLKANSGCQTQILWESFDNPTHTLLPGMKLGFNRKTCSLTSWLDEENPMPGGFTME
ncbi:S-locus-specific glycoprotein S6-like [Jatropha curcas]|uniref:S-locus-specific glycoprotein S6-like n=1 Tax=Jatropha curcas TaxID=180498 RepID=UPI0005FBE2F9|nr:S-locus-specific glycoprotein S6-like [Jatropha curcas]